MLPAGSIVGALYHKLQTQSSAPEDGRNYRPKHVELIEIINKLLLLHLVCCLCYCISDARAYKHQILKSTYFTHCFQPHMAWSFKTFKIRHSYKTVPYYCVTKVANVVCSFADVSTQTVEKDITPKYSCLLKHNHLVVVSSPESQC